MATRKKAVPENIDTEQQTSKADALRSHKATNAAVSKKTKPAAGQKKQASNGAENSNEAELANKHYNDVASHEFKGARRIVVVSSFVAGFNACKKMYGIPETEQP